MSSQQLLMAAAEATSALSEGGLTLTNSGTYNFVVPASVTSIAALVIGSGGGGGGAASEATNSAAGGGGGALSYSNAIAVTPGETLTVVVGGPGANGAGSGGGAGSVGGDSYVRRSSTDLLLAKGGGGGGGNTGSLTGGGGAGGSAAAGVGDVKNSGGAGGARATNDRGGGGGGAAGYSGVGGAGGFSTTNATAGSGGGGGGGQFGFTGTIITTGRQGGATWFYGEGANGAAGTTTSLEGKMGSAQGVPINDSFPGGGGGGAQSVGVVTDGLAGAKGAVRILWGGGKQFPSAGVTANTVSRFASASSNSSTITVPSGVQPGDLLILFDMAFGATSPSDVIPGGFSSMSSVTGENGRLSSSFKQVLSSTEGGGSLTGLNGSTSNNKILLALSGTSGYSYISNTSSGLISLSALSSTNFGPSSHDSYQNGIVVNACAFYGSSGITPATDITFNSATFVQGASNVFWVGYRIFTQSTTNAQSTIAMVDRGTNARSNASIRGS